jgi:hypothetical protein
MEITYLIIFTNKIITQSVHHFDHKAYISINYYTKNNYHLANTKSMVWNEIHPMD